MGSLLAVKLGCLAGLALLPLLCGLLPAALLRLRLRGAASADASAGFFSRRGRSLLSCAAGGVFLAACLLDIVPDSLDDLRQEMRRRSLSLDFPVPELVLALGFLLILVLEHVILDCSEPQRDDHHDDASLPLLPSPPQHPHPEGAGQGWGSEAPSSFRALVLTLSLSFHSVFEGLAVGLQETAAKVLQLTVAILLHKSVIALSLALLLLQSRLPLRWLVASLATFVLMSPLGVGLGILVTHRSASEGGGGDTARSVLEGVAAGTFMYITFLEILPHELNSSADRLPKVLAVLLGFSGMAALRFLG